MIHKKDMVDINRKIKSLHLAIIQEDKKKEQLITLEKELELLKEKIVVQKSKFIKEEKDVKSLKSFSYNRVMHKIMGDLDERIEREYKQMIEAQSEYEYLNHRYESMLLEVKSLKADLEDITLKKDERDQLVVEKKNILYDLFEEKRNFLDTCDQNRKMLNSSVKEVENTLSVVIIVQRSLERYLKKLDETSNWSTYDMIGGGLLASVAKHNKYDEVLEEGKILKKSLMQLEKSLQTSEINYQYKETSQAKYYDFEIFFDNIFLDFSFNSNINKMIDNGYQLKSKIKNIESQLSLKKKTAVDKLEVFEEKYRDEIMSM